jgi:iron complex outermembrane receptor protein
MPKSTSRRRLFAGTALLGFAVLPSWAFAQAGDNNGLEEIVVTAQKREQSVQDVPIAVTALSAGTLEANRVTNVVDLSGLAPGVTVRVSAGGSQLPVFTIRGITSFGVVPGSDKQVSQYLDGVYIGSPRGSIFDLPDLERIEVLRGPQGTLFGRNATAGAVSITTRNPTGEAHFRGEATYGNYDAFRLRASVDLPSFGPLSGYVSYLHDQRRGDITNLGAGQVWNRSTSPDSLVPKIASSPKYLGSKNTDAVFAALKLEAGDFTAVYKFDWAKGDNTPEGTGLVAVNPAVGDAGAAVAGFINALIKSQPTPVPLASDGLRPGSVMNSFVVPSSQFMMGHNLTATLIASDHLTLKNILAYRKSNQWSDSSIDGVSALPITAAAAPLFGLPAALVGQPFLIVGSQSVSRSEQWSDEFQANYQSELLTLTVGGLWFWSKDTSNTFGFQGTQTFTPVVNGVFAQGNQTATLNKLESLAAYAQAEIHVSPQLDLILGGRITHDKKFGQYTLGTRVGTPQVLTVLNAYYSNTRPSYLVGVNYKPTQDILVYAKYSTGFVSGGSIAGFAFAVEKAKSVEGGIKSELLDHKLRANLAVYWAKYDDAQSSSSASLVPGLDPRIGTFVITAGDITSKGFEFELTAAPVRGVTLGGSLSFADWKITNVNPILLASNGGAYTLTYRPKWTAGLWGEYDTQPLFGDAYLALRADAAWQSKSNVDNNPARSAIWAPNFPYAQPYWQVNARLSLRDVKLGGAKAEIAVWSKNLTDAKAPTFALDLFNQLASLNYIPARTYGADLTIEF